ncbi:MAG: signal peptidase I [Variovorax sp.]|nr:MAG: signal peptidase I [Variovorax sp.]
MAFLTSLLLAAFAGYVGAWYFGMVEGNFALLLFLATVVTGLYWLAERFYFLPRRRKAAQALDASLTERNARLAEKGITQVDTVDTKARERLLMQPWWLDWTAGLFPVILVVFVLRSFLFEPFKIPSGSMMPTLLTGDLILVNKFTYGLRLPVINTKITDGTPPARGDVMVFRYPPKPSMDYIKRVIGVPGDEVAYLNKKLTINGQPVSKNALPDFLDGDAMRLLKQFSEELDGTKHNLLNDDGGPAFVQGASDFPFRENCRYSVEGIVCKVPAGHYFMMGDNRDNSADSRYWGFVPDKNIVGRAFFVWMNFGDLGRIGPFQ